MKRAFVLAALCLALAACGSTPNGATPSTATGSTGTGATTGATGNTGTVACVVGCHERMACAAFWAIHNDTIDAQLNDPEWTTFIYQGAVAEDPAIQSNVKELSADVASYDDQAALSIEQVIASNCRYDGYPP